MSDPVVDPVSLTGTHRVLQSHSAVAGNPAPPAGNTGNELPAAPEPRDLETIVARLNAHSASIGRELRFEVDLESGRSIIHVLDRDTGEVVRQIPPEKVAPWIDVHGGVSLRLFDDMI